MTGIRLSTAIGDAVGAETAEANTDEAGFEFSHWIPTRMGGSRSIFNGNYVSEESHYLTDPFRYPSGWQELGPKLPATTQQFLRVPWVYGAGAAGAAYGGAPTMSCPQSPRTVGYPVNPPAGTEGIIRPVAGGTGNGAVFPEGAPQEVLDHLSRFQSRTAMSKPIALSKKWARYLRSVPETGIGYQVVSVTLRDGRRFNQVVIDSGYVTRVRGYDEIPFAEGEIAEITVTHDKWNWKEDDAPPD